jgi:hypothetical protein
MWCNWLIRSQQMSSTRKPTSRVGSSFMHVYFQRDGDGEQHLTTRASRRQAKELT